MTTPRKLMFLAGLLSLLLASPAVGQITNGITFQTTFPFYAGNSKMPAGAYKVTQTDGSEQTLLLIESSNGSHSAFLDVMPTTSESPHTRSDVTFNKYGNVDYLNMLWIQGQNYGMQVVPTKAEQMAGKAATASRHSLPVKAGN
jgi:hypothetical protein